MRPGEWDDRSSEGGMFGFLRSGDLPFQAGMLLALLIYIGSLFSYGYATHGVARGVGWMLCALFGLWGVGCWAAGKFRLHGLGSVRLLLALWVGTLLWAGLHLLPLPTGLVAWLSPFWRETLGMMDAVGYSRPDRIPLTINSEAAARGWHQMLASLLFFIGALALASRRSGFIFLAGLVACASVLVGWLGFFNYIFNSSTRASAVLFNPNHYAAFVVMGLPLGIWWLSTRSSWSDEEPGSSAHRDQSIFGGILVAVALIGWLLALSRGSLLAVVLVGVGGVIAHLAGLTGNRQTATPTHPRRRSTIWGLDPRIVGWTTVAVLVLLVVSGVLSGFAERTPGTDSFSSRFGYWMATLSGLVRTPILGYGFGGTEEIINRYLVGETTMVRVIWSHNDLVQVVSELGLVWGGAAVCCVVVALRRTREEWKRFSPQIPSALRGIRGILWVGVLVTAVHAILDFHLRIPLVGFHFLALAALLLTGPKAWARMRQ